MGYIVSSLKSIASGVGVVVTILGIYKAQDVAVRHMKEHDYSSDDILSGRTATVFVMSIIIGGVIDSVVKISFDDS